MKYLPPILIVFSSLVFVSDARAAVIISEVAWMGRDTSPNHEWIELYNTEGTSVDVNGWTLSDGNNLTINLEGTLAGNDYAVLERTSDESVSGSAFLIYTGALVNTGATLTLRRSDGTIEDQVAGGENWQTIGGDNDRKYTPQYSGSGWVTGLPTPGAPNATTSEPPAEESATETENTVDNEAGSNSSGSIRSKAGPSATTPLRRADGQLELTISGQTIGYVNQIIDFSVTARGVGSTINNSLVYAWNFGDTATSAYSKTKHTYRFPGTYVVTVHGAFARHSYVARHEITILPVTVALVYTKEGDVQIQNNSAYDIDISGYRVVGHDTVTFPPHSILLAKQTITIPRAKVAQAAGSVVVYDAQNKRLATTDNSKTVDALLMNVESPRTLARTVVPSPLPAPSVANPTTNVHFAHQETSVAAKEPAYNLNPTSAAFVGTEQLFATGSAVLASLPHGTATTKTSWWPYLGLVMVIGIALVGLVWSRQEMMPTHRISNTS